MTYLKQILSELREKRLWPVAVVLIAALVAVPTLLAKSSSQRPIAPLPPSTPSAASPATAVPAVSVQTTTDHSNLKGRGRDPFRQQKLPVASTSAITATTTSKKASAGSSSGSTGSKSTGTKSTGGGGTGSGSAPTSTVPPVKPKPAPAGLTATQTYRVTLAITNSAGGLDTIDSLERLSVLPSDRQPLLVELGVLRGGRRVLFAVLPGTVLSGGGSCVPGPVDCELISLAPNQTESLSRQSSTGPVAVAQFAVTQIGVDRHASAAAAAQARRTEAAAGRRRLNNSTLSTLSLFQYDAGLGAVVDQRNLTVGGN